MEQELSEQGEEAAGGAAASDQFLFNIKTIKSSKGNITVDLVMDGKDICMELDTGAALSILSETTWKRIFPKQTLNHSSVRLKTYTGEPLTGGKGCVGGVSKAEACLASSSSCW